MGIYVATQAEIQKQGLLRRRPARDDLFVEIVNAIADAVDEPILNMAIGITVWEHTVAVTVHPVGTLQFTWDPAGTMTAETKTSAAGPGYHIFAIEILKAVGKRCNLDWQWEGADEAGYVTTGDVADLEQSMAAQLQGIAKMFQRPDVGSGGLAVNVMIGYPTPKTDAFSSSPNGFWTRQWWKDVAQASGQDLIYKAREFYPWWKRDLNAEFWKNFGLTLLWNEIRWHIPGDDYQKKVVTCSLDAFRKARQLDPSIQLPDREISELEKLAAATEDDEPTPPAREGIGFYRGEMKWPATGKWSVVLPGYFYNDYEEDGTALFWFDGRTVRVSSMDVRPSEDEILSPDKLLPAKDPDAPNFVEYQTDQVKGWGTIRPAEEDGQEFMMLQGTVAAENAMCITTICFMDPADRDWAIEAFKSLDHPPHKQQPPQQELGKEA